MRRFRAAALAHLSVKAGIAIAARMPTMAITTISSINVKPDAPWQGPQILDAMVAPVRRLSRCAGRLSARRPVRPAGHCRWLPGTRLRWQLGEMGALHSSTMRPCKDHKRIHPDRAHGHDRRFAILLVIAVPTFTDFRRTRLVRGAAPTRLVSFWAIARLEALQARRAIAVVIRRSTGSMCMGALHCRRAPCDCFTARCVRRQVYTRTPRTIGTVPRCVGKPTLGPTDSDDEGLTLSIPKRGYLADGSDVGGATMRSVAWQITGSTLRGPLGARVPVCRAVAAHPA